MGILGTGARQTGKTSAPRRLFPNYGFVSLDLPTEAEQAEKEPRNLRVIHYYFPSEGQIWLMTLYDKNEASDLTAKQKQILKTALEDELRTRQTTKLRKQRKSRR